MDIHNFTFNNFIGYIILILNIRFPVWMHMVIDSILNIMNLKLRGGEWTSCSSSSSRWSTSTSATDFLVIEHIIEHFEYKRNRQNNNNNNIDRQLSNNHHKNIRVTDNIYDNRHQRRAQWHRENTSRHQTTEEQNIMKNNARSI